MGWWIHLSVEPLGLAARLHPPNPGFFSAHFGLPQWVVAGTLLLLLLLFLFLFLFFLFFIYSSSVIVIIEELGLERVDHGCWDLIQWY